MNIGTVAYIWRVIASKSRPVCVPAGNQTTLVFHADRFVYV